MGKRIEDDEFDNNLSQPDFPDSEVGEKMKRSLARILYQTSRDLCMNTGLSIGTVIDWLEGNGDEIYGEQVGNIWVYYLKNNTPSRLEKPQKLYFGGNDGRTLCLRAAPDRGNTGAHKKGDQVANEFRRPCFDEKISRWANIHEKNMQGSGGKPDLDEDDEIEDLEDGNFSEGKEDIMKNLTEKSIDEVSDSASPPPAAIGKSSLRTRKPISISAAELENLAMQNLSQREAAKKLGIGYSTFTRRLGDFESLRQAWERGAKSAARNDDPPEEGKKSAAAKPKLRSKDFKTKPASGSFTPEKLQALSKEFGSYNQAAKSLGVDVTTVRYHALKTPENKAAWFNGQAEFIKNKTGKNSIAEAAPSELPEIASAKVKNAASCAEKVPEEVMEQEIEKVASNEPVAQDAAHAAQISLEKSAAPPEEDNSSEPNDQLIINPRFEHTLEHIAESGHSREKIEEVKNKLMPQRNNFFGGEVEILGKIIAAPPKGLNINFTGDFFALPKKQRRILCELAALNDEFREVSGDT